MLVNRTEQHQICKSNSMWKTIDDLSFKSKNLYNYANYIIRQEFIFNKKYIKYNQLDNMLHDHEPYTEFGSQVSQQTLRLLDKNWKSFFIAIKNYSKHPEKYLGRPRLPKYKKKDGRNIVMVKNIQCRIENSFLIFSWKPLRQFIIPTKINGKLMQVRFIPRGSIYVMEIVYQIEIPDTNNELNKICSIDLGLNNFATLTNNVGLKPIIINGKIIKSMNQYYNKKKANYQSILKTVNKKEWSNKLNKLTLKRNNKINNYLHKASKYIIDYCFYQNINTIIIGHNEGWKQNSQMSKLVNQSFIQIPYNKFIQMVQYKAENYSIKVICTEEAYTSGTSFLDNELPIKENYNKKRRIKRGLFKSNTGKFINSDINGSLQIMKKVFPNAFADGIEGLDLIPTVINL